MNTNKVAPIKKLIQGNIEILKDQKRIIINHLLNEGIDSDSIIEKIETTYAKIEAKLFTIFMHMESLDNDI